MPASVSDVPPEEETTDFWVYVQPVALYELLGLRSKHNPSFLRRNLSYVRAGNQRQTRRKGDKLSIEVANLTGCGVTVSTLVVLCRKLSQQDYVPLRAALMHVPPTVKDPTDPHPYPEISFYPPTANVATDYYGPEAGLVLLFAVWDDHPDLSSIKVFQGQPLTTETRRDRISGLIPVGSRVRWGELAVWEPLRSYNRTHQVLLGGGVISVADITLQPPRSRLDLQPKGVQVLRFGGPQQPPLGPQSPALPSNAHLVDPLKLQVILRREFCTHQPPNERKDGALANLDEGRVFFRYFYGKDDERMLKEKVLNYGCPFCDEGKMNCANYTGLRVHLQSSHDLFDYGFCTDHPEVPRYIDVRCPAELYDEGGQLRSKEAETYVLRPTAKDFYMHSASRCVSGSLGQPHQWKTTKQQQLLLSRRPSVDSTSAGSDKDVDRRWKRFLAPRRCHPGAAKRSYFHSRTAVPMTVKEKVGCYDSDDEEDFSQWKIRCQRKTNTLSGVTREEKEFMMLWNCFAHTQPVFSDQYTATACETFARQHIQQLQSNGALRQCFSVHLMNLWEYALMDAATLSRCLDIASGKSV